MSHTPGVRQVQKQQSRRALLDAALGLLEHQNLSGLGVREVTRAAGLSPAGFYRHFPDLSELAVVLVEESLASVHAMIRSVLAEQGDDSEQLIDRTVELIADHVRENPAHMRFLVRERHGGVRAVREAIAGELGGFTDEVAAGLGAQSVSAGWSAGDLRMLARLYVEHMVATAAEFLEAGPGGEQRIAQTARTQLRLIGVGRRHWPEG